MATIDPDSSAVVALPPSINVADKLPAVRVSVPIAKASPPRAAERPSESSGLEVCTIVVTAVEVEDTPVESAFVTPVPVPDTVEKE
jgi:hypothetical protein